MDNRCRLCQGANGILITPCKCEGSIGYAHPRCLAEWICRRNTIECEICGASYIFCQPESLNTPILSIRGASLLLKGLMKVTADTIRKLGFEALYMVELTLVRLAAGYGYYYLLFPTADIFKSFTSSLDIFKYAEDWFLVGLIGRIVLTVFQYFLLVYNEWSEWVDRNSNHCDKLFYRHDPEEFFNEWSEEMLEESESLNDGAETFLLGGEEHRKVLSRPTGLQQKAILSSLNRQLQSVGNTKANNFGKAFRLASYFFLFHFAFYFCYELPHLGLMCIASLSQYFLSSTIPIAIKNVLILVSYIYRSPSVVIYTFCLSGITTPLVCWLALIVLKSWKKRQIAIFFQFLNGAYTTLSFSILTFITIASILICFNWRKALDDAYSYLPLRVLEENSILPIYCSRAYESASISTPATIQAAMAIVANGVSVNRKMIDVIDLKSCFHLCSFSGKMEHFHLSFLLLSKLNLWNAFVMFQGMLAPTFIIWTNLSNIHFFSKMLPRLTQDSIFYHFCNISVAHLFATLFKITLFFVAVDRTFGELIFRFASLHSPGNLSININKRLSDDPFLILVTVSEYWFYYKVYKELHTSIRHLLMKLTGVIESIEGNILGSDFRRIAFFSTHFLFTVIIIEVGSARFYFFSRWIYDINMTLDKFMLILFHIPFFVFCIAAALVRKKMCFYSKIAMYKFMMYGKFNLHARYSSKNGGCFICSTSSLPACTLSTSVLAFEEKERMMLKIQSGKKFKLSLNQVQRLARESFSSHYCVFMHVFIPFLMVAIPFFFPLCEGHPFLLNYSFGYLELSPSVNYISIYAVNALVLIVWFFSEYLNQLYLKQNAFHSIARFCYYCDALSIISFLFFAWTRFLLINAVLSCFLLETFSLMNGIALICLVSFLLVFLRSRITFLKSDRKNEVSVTKISRKKEIKKNENDKLYMKIVKILKEQKRYVEDLSRSILESLMQINSQEVYFDNCRSDSGTF